VKQEESQIILIEDLGFEVQKDFLNDKINSSENEKSPKVSPDGNTLFFSREIPDSIREKDSDVYFAVKDSNGEFSEVLDIGKPINNLGYNTVISITSDGNTLMVMNTYKEDGSPLGSGISISRKTNNKWEIPKKVNIEDHYNHSKYAEYVLSADGTLLLFTSQRNETFGMKDIYVSFKKDDGSFTIPKNLGPIVNTFADETGVFLAPDLKTIYYSTAGFKGYGLDDIYMSKRLDETWTNWTQPINLGNQINSNKWDSYLTLDASGEFAFMTNSRNGKKLDLIKLNLPPSLRPDPVCLVKGTIRDSKTKEIISTIVQYKDLKTNEIMGTASSDDVTGAFQIILLRGKKYSFNAKKEGYYPISQNLDLSEIDKYQEVEVDLFLTPIEKGAEIVLNNLFFDYNKADLQTDSHSELNSLVEFLKTNEGIKIEIIGHTDDQGSSSYNLKLSEDRAKSVLEYLNNKGISKDRLSSVGYGKTKPIVKNDSDENRAKNRRVEFKIK
jgi:outer membrane protein OmpA-like peptidoglycan-associated protein